jgi:hypothetical protein
LIEDKAEVSMRGEWAGIAVNLRTNTPSPEAIRDGVDRILIDVNSRLVPWKSDMRMRS